MATLVNIQEQWSGVDGSVEQTNVVGAQQGNASRKWTVLYDSAASGLNQLAIDATGIPDIGDAHPTWSWLPCRRKRSVPLGPMLFEVTAEYYGKDSPLSAPAEISWQDATTMEPTEEDGNGDLLANTAGDPVDGLAANLSDPVYVFTRNEATYPAAAMLSYWNKVNNATFMGWDANAALMLPITAARRDDGTSFYYVVTYRVQFRSDGWNHRFVNKGKRYRPSAGAPLVSVRDRLGVDTALLATNGTLLADGGTPIWITKPMYDSADFSALSIT